MVLVGLDGRAATVPRFPGAKLSQALPQSEFDNRSTAEMAGGNPQSAIINLPHPMPSFDSPFLAVPAGDRVRSNDLAIAIPNPS